MKIKDCRKGLSVRLTNVTAPSLKARTGKISRVMPTYNLVVIELDLPSTIREYCARPDNIEPRRY